MIQSFGHRGAKGYVSENTLASFQKALDLNADGIRRTKLQKNGRIVLTSDKEDILLAHIKPATFTRVCFREL